MFHLTRKCFGVCLLLLLFAQVSNAASLRGRVIHAYPGRVVGVPNLAVTVYSPTFGRSTPAYTGADGVFYLAVPAGSYHLEIWVNPQTPLTYPINVGEPGVDIPPITI
jgi:hypothetical protein